MASGEVKHDPQLEEQIDPATREYRVIAPGQTFGSVTEKITRIVLTPETPLGWFGFFGVAGAGATMLLVAVTWLFLDRPHPEFEVAAEARVDVEFPPPPMPDDTRPWDEVALIARGRGAAVAEAAEFAEGSPMAPAHEGAARYAAASFTPQRPMLAALLDLNARIRRDFAFKAGITTLSTPITEVLSRRAGVCQDFTHLMIGALRGLGLPARYVSGYIRTRPPPGQARAMPSRCIGSTLRPSARRWRRPASYWLRKAPCSRIRPIRIR